MDITVNKNYTGIHLKIEFTDGNHTFKYEDDIEERTYAKKEDGKTDFMRKIGSDVKTDVIDKYSRILSDLICYRNEDYDASDLIKQLFEKLPKDKVQDLLKELVHDYKEEEDGE